MIRMNLPYKIKHPCCLRLALQTQPAKKNAAHIGAPPGSCFKFVGFGIWHYGDGKRFLVGSWRYVTMLPSQCCGVPPSLCFWKSNRPKPIYLLHGETWRCEDSILYKPMWCLSNLLNRSNHINSYLKNIIVGTEGGAPDWKVASNTEHH